MLQLGSLTLDVLTHMGHEQVADITTLTMRLEDNLRTAGQQMIAAVEASLAESSDPLGLLYTFPIGQTHTATQPGVIDDLTSPLVLVAVHCIKKKCNMLMQTLHQNGKL